MDVALFFFLPLVGGFRFILGSILTRYRAARQEAQRLYYLAAFTGILLSVLGLAAHTFLQAHVASYRDATARLDRALLTPLLDRPAAAGAAPLAPASVQARSMVVFACLMSLVLGICGAPLLNTVLRIADWLYALFWHPIPSRSIRARIYLSAITDQLEMLLFEAQLTTTQVQVTLSNNKVYAGWVNESVDARAQQKYIRLQPSMSGYRQKDTAEVEFTTFYHEVLKRYAADPVRLRAYEVVVPVERIVSASGFDAGDYAEFKRAREAALEAATRGRSGRALARVARTVLPSFISGLALVASARVMAGGRRP